MPETIRCLAWIPQLTSERINPCPDVRVTVHGWNKPTEEVGRLFTAMDKTE